VTDQELSDLLAALSGILWLGNLKVDSAYFDEASKIRADAALSNAAALLGLDEKQLAHALTHKKVGVTALPLLLLLLSLVVCVVGVGWVASGILMHLMTSAAALW
jgi:hypothetical protein